MRRGIVIALIVFSLLSPVIAISCDSTQEPEAEEVIGPDGGVVEVTDPESSLAGTRIDIPEDAVTEDTIFTISEVADPPELPNPQDIAVAGPTANIEASNELTSFVAVTIPCPPATDVKQIIKVYYYNEVTSEWEEVPTVFGNAETGTITILTDHLSWYRAVIEALNINPESLALSGFYLASDRTSFDNSYYVGSSDPDACTLGMCHGMSSLVKYWYENKDTNLRCAYSPEAGAPVSCNLQLMHEHIWSTPLLLAELSTTGIFDATDVWQSCLISLQNGDVPLIAMCEELLGGHHCVAAYRWEKSTAGDILGYLYIYDPNEPENADLKITCRATTLLGIIPVVEMEYSNYGYTFKYFANSFIYKSKSVVEDLISDFPPDTWCGESMDLEITAASDSKVYDGTPLTNSGYSITGGILGTGHSLVSVTITGSQTGVGSSDNVPIGAVIMNNGTDVTANYNITYVNGTLTVTSSEEEPEYTPMVAACGRHTAGVKSDGTVVAVGYNDWGQCDVGGWTNIVEAAGGWFYTVGVKSDGTVVAVGWNGFGPCNVEGWTNIIQIDAGTFHTVGLKDDGTVVAVGDYVYEQLDVDSWTGIVQVAAGLYHTVGLEDDGTVVAVGSNGWGQCAVGGWTDITQVAAGHYHTVGLKDDGTVVAVGVNNWGLCDVVSWTNIIQIDAGKYHTVGLKDDGTVVVVGDNDDGQCNVSGWTDIIQVAAGRRHTVGLKSDGTVVAVGDNSWGRCNVGSWDLI